jgi:proteasome lid subunit RPN8/RPN11
MSDVRDPQDGFESQDFEPAISGDKRIIFGARKPTEEASPLTGIPVLIEAPFPHERTLHWWPAELPVEFTNGNTAVIVSQEVIVKVNEHVAQSLDHELGGFLLGNRYRCPNTSCDYVIIDQYSPAKYTESSEVRLNFTHDAWAQLSDELSGKFLGKLLIGWYHSHPRMDVFLSSHDMEIQTERFPKPWMVALVLEPEKHLGGFFCARDGRVRPNSPVDFFELLERNSRDSVIGWDNYRPVDPALGSTPVVSPTVTGEATETPSPEPPVIETQVSEKSPFRKKRRGRWLFITAAVLLVLAGAVAAGVIKRNRIKEWLQNRGIVATPTYQATPAPSVEQTPIPQNVAATPEASPASSPTPSPASSPRSSPQASPTPAETSQTTSNTNQPAAAQSPAKPAGTPKRSTRRKRRP